MNIILGIAEIDENEESTEIYVLILPWIHMRNWCHIKNPSQ